MSIRPCYPRGGQRTRANIKSSPKLCLLSRHVSPLLHRGPPENLHGLLLCEGADLYAQQREGERRRSSTELPSPKRSTAWHDPQTAGDAQQRRHAKGELCSCLYSCRDWQKMISCGIEPQTLSESIPANVKDT
jgi:hypothetical protein